MEERDLNFIEGLGSIWISLRACPHTQIVHWVRAQVGRGAGL